MHENAACFSSLDTEFHVVDMVKLLEIIFLTVACLVIFLFVNKRRECTRLCFEITARVLSDLRIRLTPTF